jgi:squalene-hopene/tetraprenyl-beta-curcumene cyclase
VVSGNDGGAVYHPGSSKVGPPEKQPDGTYVIRSYGSMTYALLKCLLFCGVEPSDPRVQAAVKWIQENWTVEHNPGFLAENDSYQGHFYYLHTAARALAEYEAYTGKPLVIRDANGQAHDWRQEMAGKILAMQRPDGSWSNEKSERWDEALPALATSYMLQSLAFITGRLP